AVHGGLAQLVATKTELAVDAAGTTGQHAAIALANRAGVARQLLQPHRRFHLLVVGSGRADDDLLQRRTLVGVLGNQLLALGLALDHGGLGHYVCLPESVAERETEGFKQRLGFVVGLGGGGHGNVHAAHRVNLVEIDLREDDLFLDAHVVVAAAVEALAIQATEIADARQRDVDQAIHELVHAVAAQGDLAANRPAIADLEAGNRDTSLGHDGLLTGDLGHVVNRVVEHLLVADRLAHA